MKRYNEFNKILIYRKFLFGIAGLLIAGLLFFAYQNRNGNEVLPDSSEYSEGYSSYIKDIINRADKMNAVSVFMKPGSFSKKNIEKTVHDYKKLLNVSPVNFDNSFLNAHFQYKELAAFVFIAGFMIVLMYRQDRKKGIRALLYSTEKGRGTLAIRKFLAILVLDIAITFIFYGTNLILSSIIYNGNISGCLTYPIQSLSMFKDFTVNINIGWFLICYYLYRSLILFVVSVVIWTIFAAFKSDIPAIGIIAAVIVVEYILSRLPNDNTAGNLLKYCNFYNLASGNVFFTKYKNINLFKHAVGKNILGILFTAVNFIVFFVAGILIAKYSRTYGTNRKSSFLEKIYSSITGFFQIKTPELYKMLWCEKGIVVIVLLAVILVRNTDFNKIMHVKSEDMYFEFIAKYEGTPNDESAAEIEKLRKELLELDTKFQAVEEAFENGTVELEEYIKMQMVFQAYMEDRLFLEIIDSETEYLKSLETEGIKGWYVNKYKYRNLLNNNNKTFTNLLTFVVIVLLCSGLFYYEKKKNMPEMLRQCINGRKKLFYKKTLLAVSVALLTVFFEIMLEIVSNAHVYGKICLQAPVQSLSMFSFVKWHCSIGTFIFFVYFIRISVVVLVAVSAAMLSQVVEQVAAMLIAFVICIPTVLYLIGINFMEKFSVIDVMTVSEYMIRHQSMGSVIFAAAALLVLTVVLYRTAYRRWCK